MIERDQYCDLRYIRILDRENNKKRASIKRETDALKKRSIDFEFDVEFDELDFGFAILCHW